MEILATIVLAFLALRTLVSLVNALSGLHLPKKKPANFPKVSVLIPARNEEAAIGKLLRSLEQQDYPDFEVIVCDDHSSDNTDEVVNWFAGEDARFHVFLSEKLPDDWLGKNFACHQLAQRATGQYLIFLDADVELSPDALSRAVAFFQQKKLSLLSIFPQQRMNTFAELSSVPVMNWILQSLLPMILVQKTRFPSLSAANGQFMMFDGAEYRKHQWHSRVRDLNVEDIRLARLVKSEGLNMAVLLGDQDIFCRMYHLWSEAVRGFSRNIHEYFGGNRAILIGFWLIILLGPFIIWAVLGNYFLGLFVLLVVINRALVAVAGRQSGWSVLLHPVQMISLSVIVFYHLYRRMKKDTEWKGRKIKFQD